MAKYEVIKQFPATPLVQRGQVIENPKWRNLGSLIRSGYLREVVEENEAETAEVSPKAKKKGVKNGNK